MKRFDKQKLRWVVATQEHEGKKYPIALLLYYGKRQMTGQILPSGKNTYRAISLSTEWQYFFMEKSFRSLPKAQEWLLEYTVDLYMRSESKPEFFS